MREVDDHKNEFGESPDAYERFRDYADADADWFWEIDPNFKFTIISKRFDGRSGIRENDLLGLTPWEFADADPVTDSIWANLLTKLNRREAFRQFRVCIRNEETPIYWRVSGKPVINNDGRFLGYRGIATDETVDALRQSNLETLLGDYRSAFDSIAEGVACFDARNKLVFVNAAFWKWVPVSPHRIRPGISDEAFFTVVDAAVASIDGVSSEVTSAAYRRAAVWQMIDGKIIQAGYRSLPSFGYALTLQPSAENKGDSASISKDAGLSKDAGRFRDIVTRSPQGFFIHVDGHIVFANQAAADMFGCPYAEFIGSEILDFAVPEEVPRLREYAYARLNGKVAPEKYQFTGRRRDGISLRIELLVQMGDWHGEKAFHVFAQDRSSEHQALRALSDSERRFRDLIEGSIQGYFVHSDWKIIYANSAAAGIFGYDPAEFVGLDLRQLIAPEERDAITELRDRRLAGDVDAPERYDVGGVRKDGSALVFETFSRLIDWDGKPAIQATILDVTERKNVEMHLMYAKETAERADRAKTEFLGNMSHEFRTPLNAIIGFSQMIKDQMMGEALPQYVDYAGAINSSGIHLLDVVNDLLDVASIESGTLTISEDIVDLVDACKSCERMLRHRAQKSQIIVSLHVPDAPIPFRGDLRRLKQILINLVGNAIKFTDPDGRVTVMASVDEEGCTRLRVSDTGIGISKEHLSNVFNPFYRVDTHYVSQREGTGLGLPLVKALADLHGATIKINSELNVGTQIELVFPPDRTIIEKI